MSKALKVPQPAGALPAVVDNVWQRAIEMVQSRQYRQAAALIDTAGTATSAETTTLLRQTMSAAQQICLACDRFLQENHLLQHASQLAADQERELGKHLMIILQEALSQLVVAPALPEPVQEREPTAAPDATSDRPPGLWHRLHRLLSAREGHLLAHKDAPGVVDEGGEDAPGSPPAPGAERIPTFVVFGLGQFRFYDGDRAIVEWPNRKSKSVLKFLLLHGDHPVRKDVLMEAFWPDHEPSAARNNLNVAIYTLRQALRGAAAERSTILFHDESYALNPDLGVWLDVDEFRHCIAAGRRAMRRGHLEEAVREYETAVELYQGDLLEEDLYEPWTEQPRRALRETYVDALNFLSGYYFEAGQDAVCVGYCRKLLLMEPADEAIHRRLMRAYGRQNQRYLAIRQYQQCIEALREHLDVAPDAETVQLYERIVHKRPV